MKPTEEQLKKLPKWAQQHIQSLELENGSLKAQVAAFDENQELSPFFVDEWSSTPRRKRYIKAFSNRICVEHLGVHCEIFLPYPGDGQRLQGIEISFRDTERFNVSAAIYPRSCGTIQILRPDYHPTPTANGGVK